MHHDRPAAVSLSMAAVTPDTRWIFVEIETIAGLWGVGEATLPGQEHAVADAVAALTPIALALTDIDPDGLSLDAAAALPVAAAHSAFDQALWDIVARQRGARLAEALGTVRRDRVPVYANINRRTRDRSPAGFAASAQAALAAGHTAIKLAPFDEATGGTDIAATLQPGLARIAAVRDMIGPTTGLMIDCHWRLDPASAEYAIAAAAELGVTWIECPLPETPDTIPAIARLRAVANRHDMLLAGMETAIGIQGFAPFIAAGAYDVMMPDIKYVGGLTEVIRLAELFQAAGIGFSPHSPSGPVCHAVSLQVCAVVESVHSLETQFDETPLFDALIDIEFDPAGDGMMGIPTGPGAGVALRHDALQPHRSMYWTTAT